MYSKQFYYLGIHLTWYQIIAFVILAMLIDAFIGGLFIFVKNDTNIGSKFGSQVGGKTTHMQPCSSAPAVIGTGQKQDFGLCCLKATFFFSYLSFHSILRFSTFFL